MKLKRNATDDYFSKIVRQRANWHCELCGKDFSNDHKGIQCSHFIGRGNKVVRYDFENAAALCGTMAPWGLTGCHKIVSEDPSIHYEFFLKRLGKEKLEALIFRSRNETMKSQGVTEVDKRLELRMEWKRMQSEEKKNILGG
jgi:hypothetical protein